MFNFKNLAQIAFSSKAQIKNIYRSVLVGIAIALGVTHAQPSVPSEPLNWGSYNLKGKVHQIIEVRSVADAVSPEKDPMTGKVKTVPSDIQNIITFDESGYEVDITEIRASKGHKLKQTTTTHENGKLLRREVVDIVNEDDSHIITNTYDDVGNWLWTEKEVRYPKRITEFTVNSKSSRNQPDMFTAEENILLTLDENRNVIKEERFYPEMPRRNISFDYLYDDTGNFVEAQTVLVIKAHMSMMKKES